MRTVLRAAFALLITLGILLPAVPARAHDELVSTNPAANATVSQAPTELTLTFSANLMNIESGNRVRVTDSAGNSLVEGKGDVAVKGNTVTQTVKVADPKADETYTVTWRVVSSDGHPIQGTYTFNVGAGKSAPAGTDATENNGDADTGSGWAGPLIVPGVIIITVLAAGAVAVLALRRK